MNIEEIKKVFMFETERIWGKKVADYIEMEYVIKHQKPRMSIGGFYKRPKAIGTNIVYMDKKHTLYISKDFYENASDEEIISVIRHEVIHLGHQLHNKEFFELAQKFNASLTGESSRSNLPPFQCQIKEGSRYRTIQRFNTEDESYMWLKSYCKQHNIRGRIKV